MLVQCFTTLQQTRNFMQLKDMANVFIWQNCQSEEISKIKVIKKRTH